MHPSTWFVVLFYFPWKFCQRKPFPSLHLFDDLTPEEQSTFIWPMIDWFFFQNILLSVIVSKSITPLCFFPYCKLMHFFHHHTILLEELFNYSDFHCNETIFIQVCFLPKIDVLFISPVRYPFLYILNIKKEKYIL